MEFLQEEFEEILNIFRAESEEIFQRMNGNVLLLEKNADDKTLINKLFRDAHSLKGASRMVGFNKIQVLAHRVEDILDFANLDKIIVSPEIAGILYKVLDYIAELVTVSVQNQKETLSPEFENHLAILDNIIENPDQTQFEPVKNEVSHENQVEEYKKYYNEINLCLSQINFILKNFDEDDKKIIDELMSNFTELDSYFDSQHFKYLKSIIKEFLDKLNFVKRATGYLIQQEINEFFTDLERIKEILNKLIPPVSHVKEKKQENVDVPASDTSFEESQQEEAETPDEINEKINALIIAIPELEFDLELIEKIKENIDFIIENSNKETFNQLYVKIYELLEDFKNKNIKPQQEILNLIKQCLKDSKEILSTNDDSENDSVEAILQRLSIVRHIVDLDSANQPDEIAPSASDMQAQAKFEKPKDFLKTYETVSIKTLRVDTQKLDQLVNQMSELLTARIKLKDHVKELNELSAELTEWSESYQKPYKLIYNENQSKIGGSASVNINPIHQNMVDNNAARINSIKNSFNALSSRLKEDHVYYNHTVDDLELMIKNVRILPLASVFHMFPRMVRDIAREKNKEIELLISGSETSADKKIIEEIKSPLIHIIRNSIDHGIESPEERTQKGKSPTGKIQLSAYRLSNKIVIEIKDDGRGVNLEKIKMKALTRGMLSEHEIRVLSDEQIMNLIFLPGFSTGEEVTDISGRGVGLDVVQTKITQLDGKVKIYSVLGEGAKVTIELPVTMATMKTFIVSAQEQLFAIPIASINFALHANRKDVFTKDGAPAILHNEKVVPLFKLDELLNLEHKDITESEKLTVLIIESENQLAGLIIDRLEGDQEILQKKFSPPIFRLKNIIGLSTLTSGRVCYILNISDIFKTIASTDNLLQHQQPDKVKMLTDMAKNKDYKVLSVTYSPENALNIDNILNISGYNWTNVNDNTSVFKKLGKESFNLISINLTADTENGIELIKAIRTNELYDKVPLIAILREETEELMKNLSIYSINDYITQNNFDPQNYLYKIQKILNP